MREEVSNRARTLRRRNHRYVRKWFKSCQNPKTPESLKCEKVVSSRTRTLEYRNHLHERKSIQVVTEP